MTRRPAWLDDPSITITDLTDRDLIKEVEQMAGTHPVDIARRLGASLSGLESRLQNAGRPDLAVPFAAARAAERAAGVPA